MTYQLTSLMIGLSLAGVILWLVGRAPPAWPPCHLVDRPGRRHHPARLLAPAHRSDRPLSGGGLPPIVAVILGFALVLVKMMDMDLQRSRQEQRLRRLAQRLALLEARIEGGAALAPEAGCHPDRNEPRDLQGRRID